MSDLVEVRTETIDALTGERKVVVTQEPAPPYVPEPVPVVISRFQARAALMDAGLLADVELALADADPIAQLAWAEATEWRRDSPTIAALAEAIGLTDVQVDALFLSAAEIFA